MDDQYRIDLQTVCPEIRVLEIFMKLEQILLHSDVGQVRHHMADHLEPLDSLNVSAMVTTM